MGMPGKVMRFQELLYEQALPPTTSSLSEMRHDLALNLPPARSRWTSEDVQLLSTEVFANGHPSFC